MIDRLMLDAGPLGRLCHPYARGGDNTALVAWLLAQEKAEVELCESEVTDYEVRRELLRVRAMSQLARPDEFLESHTLIPLDRETMLLAATLWAQARRSGYPTADPSELDCDVNLAAQVKLYGGTVVTDNVRHLSRFIDAQDWKELIRKDGVDG